jgi:hypothetical protein
VNIKNLSIYTLFLAAWIGGQALADWQAAAPNNVTITFDSVTNGSKQIPKHVNVDVSGTQVGTPTNPVYVNPVSGGNAAAISAAGALSANISQLNGSAVSTSNPLPTSPTVGGAAASATNPLPLQLSQGGNLVNGSNPIPGQLVVGGAAVSSGNPIPVVTTQTEPVTYSASASTSIQSSATDFVIIQGSATKLIKIRRIGINYGSGGSVYTSVMRRSTAQTGGTCSSATIMKHDTADATSAVPSLVACTANPSVGTLVGRIRSAVISSAGATIQQWTFSGVNDKPIMLRGTTDFITLNAEASNVGILAFWYIEWTEE